MAGNKNCGRKKILGSDVIVIYIETTIVDDVDDVDDVGHVVDDVVVAAAVVDYFYGPVISGSGSEQQRSQKAHY